MEKDLELKGLEIQKNLDGTYRIEANYSDCYWKTIKTGFRLELDAKLWLNKALTLGLW